MNAQLYLDLIHDIKAIFSDNIKEELQEKNRKWVEIQLAEGINITCSDFPHLLTIASGYNVIIEIFPVYPNQLGITFMEIKK